jgi:hypothetical protein
MATISNRTFFDKFQTPAKARPCANYAQNQPAAQTTDHA